MQLMFQEKLLSLQTNECPKLNFQQSGDINFKDVPLSIHHECMSWRWEPTMEHVTSLAASLEPLAYRRNVAQLNSFL